MYEQLTIKYRATGRIELDPQKVALDFQIGSGLKEEDYPWADRVRTLMQTADQVFFRALEKCFRFQKSVHRVSPTKQIITLGTQSDINTYAKKHWDKINYFFAGRKKGYNFDIRKMVTCREDRELTSTPLDIDGRVFINSDEDICQLNFLATGAGASNEVINWRSSIDEGSTGRFSLDGIHVRFKVPLAKQPLTFLHEIREEFNNHSYEFEGEQISKELKKVTKRSKLQSETTDA